MGSINYGTAAPGLGRLAVALGGGGYQRGYENELNLQSKLAQAMAAIDAHTASADLNRAKAAGEQSHQAMQTPEALQRTSMLSAGVPLDEAPAVDSYLRTGQLGGKYKPLAEGLPGPVAPAPDWQSKLGEVARAMALNQRAIAIGDKNSENVAKAGSIERGDRLSDAIINGTANRNTVAGAQAAASGKDLFHADSTGSVLDKFTGGLNTDNPMARGTIDLRGAQAGNQRAGAAAHNALADQRRQVTANGPGPGKVPVGYRYTRGEDGEMRLEPIPGGPKDPNAQTGKPLPASASKGYLDNLQNLDRAQRALDLVEGKTVGAATGDPEATGLKGMLPNQVLNRIDPEGVDTRAAIADLGSLVIHDRSGAAVTAAEYPRLAPFIPSATDDAKTVAKKLKLFVQNYKALVDDSAEFYKSSGYNVPALTRKQHAAVAPRGGGAAAGPVTVKSDAEYNALPSGAEFIAPDGSHRRKP